MEDIPAITRWCRHAHSLELAKRSQKLRGIPGAFHRGAHHLRLACQAHQAQGRDRAEQHLFSGFALPVGHRMIVVLVIGCRQCQPHVQVWQVCAAVHGSSSSDRAALLKRLESIAR